MSAKIENKTELKVVFGAMLLGKEGAKNDVTLKKN
jgi:hypothetical protein